MTTREAIAHALVADRLIDIVTTGARSGLPRRTEIWFTNVSGQIIICGTPAGDGTTGSRRPRDWLANLVANPDFVFCLKDSVQVELPAHAEPVRDLDERRRLFLAPETDWYREHSASVDALVAYSPLVTVRFTGDYEWLNTTTR